MKADVAVEIVADSAPKAWMTSTKASEVRNVEPLKPRPRRQPPAPEHSLVIVMLVSLALFVLVVFPEFRL